MSETSWSARTWRGSSECTATTRGTRWDAAAEAADSRIEAAPTVASGPPRSASACGERAVAGLCEVRLWDRKGQGEVECVAWFRRKEAAVRECCAGWTQQCLRASPHLHASDHRGGGVGEKVLNPCGRNVVVAALRGRRGREAGHPSIKEVAQRDARLDVQALEREGAPSGLHRSLCGILHVRGPHQRHQRPQRAVQGAQRRGRHGGAARVAAPRRRLSARLQSWI